MDLIGIEWALQSDRYVMLAKGTWVPVPQDRVGLKEFYGKVDLEGSVVIGRRAIAKPSLHVVVEPTSPWKGHGNKWHGVRDRTEAHKIWVVGTASEQFAIVFVKDVNIKGGQGKQGEKITCKLRLKERSANDEGFVRIIKEGGD